MEFFRILKLVDPSGFEPEVPALQRQCITRLCYGPDKKVIVYNRILSVTKVLNVKYYEKEVIQPQVPLRLPCDDLTHLTEFRFGSINKLILI